MNLVELFDNIVQMQNLNGVPLAAGKLYVYALGRTRLMDTWSDVDGENLNPNPVILDNAGQAHVFVSDDFDYTLVVCDQYNNEIFSLDKYFYSKGEHSHADVAVAPSETIAVSSYNVGETTVYVPYLVGEVGKTYEGIEPIVVNNDVNRISANHVPLGLQEPLFFVQDDENACIIGCSAQTEIPSSVSSKWEDASNTVSSNSAQWGAGTVYTPGDYIDIQNDVISVTGLQPAGDYAYNSAVSSKLETTAFSTVSGNFLTAVDLTPYQEKTAMSGYLTTGDSAQFYTNDNPSGFITGVDLSDYATTGDLANKLDTTAFSNVSGDFITALPEDLVYTGDLSDYAKKDFVNDSIDSATSGLLPTSSFSSVSGSFLTALPSDLVYTADITGKLDTSVYATDSAMFSGAIDYVSANVVDPVTSPLGTILVNGSEIEATNSAINLTGVKTPYTSSMSINVSDSYVNYTLNFGTFNTGSILIISGNGYEYNPKPDFVIRGCDSANNLLDIEIKNQSGSLDNLVSVESVLLLDGRTGDYNFELSSYTLGSGVDELAWKSELNDLPGYDYLQANYQPQSAMTAYMSIAGALQNFQLKQNMTAYQPVSGMTAYLTTGDSANFYTTANESGFITGVDLTPYQTTAGMTAYQPAGDYLTTADSAQFITALPADLVYTADITGFATTADLTSKLDKSDSANFYTTANESGFITGIPNEVTDAASTVASNSANWNSTYNTVSTNSADWSVSEEISGINGIKISESADKVIIEVSANYATEDWVTGQGYITGINYNTGSI